MNCIRKSCSSQLRKSVPTLPKLGGRASLSHASTFALFPWCDGGISSTICISPDMFGSGQSGGSQETENYYLLLFVVYYMHSRVKYRILLITYRITGRKGGNLNWDPHDRDECVGIIQANREPIPCCVFNMLLKSNTMMHLMRSYYYHK